MDISPLLSFGMLEYTKTKQANDEKLEQLRKEYQNLQNLPRKLKKQRKKSILLDWNIFMWAKEQFYNY